MSTITTTLEIGAFELEVEIEYMAYPGEKMVWRDRNGDGYPGSPPYAELIGVKAIDAPEFNAIAYKAVERRWKRFGDMCLEDANERYYEERS